MIKGVIFDMDGVLVDSEQFICEAGVRMFAEKGLMVKHKDFKEFTGMGEDRYLGGVAEKYNFPFDVEKDKARTYEIYEQLVSGRLKPLPGVFSFIEMCREHNLKLAVASSADKVKVEINLRETGLSQNVFDVVVNGLDVQRKKPYPDIFIKAAESLLLSPQECLVAEDSKSGVSAAKAAGCRCLALTTSFSPDNLSEADWIVKDLSYANADCISW